MFSKVKFDNYHSSRIFFKTDLENVKFDMFLSTLNTSYLLSWREGIFPPPKKLNHTFRFLIKMTII